LFSIKDTLFIGKNFIQLDEVKSTNTFLQQIIQNTKLADGTVVSTFHQTHGRGHQESRWHGEKNRNISFSILLYPDFLPASRQFLLSMACSLGIADALYDHIGESFKIKWPNDIYFQEKKAGGLLIENSIIGTQLKHSILGIGINVNQSTFPEDLPNPVSLKQLDGKDRDLYELIAALCAKIEDRYQQLRKREWAQIEADYVELLLGKDETRNFRDTSGAVFKGMITGVDEHGRLMMDVDGQVKLWDFKQILMLLD